MSARLPLPEQVFGHGWVYLQGRADEQVARATSSIRSTPPSASAPIRCACTSSKEVPVRRRRRLHLGALRGEVQRRPGQQPRQPGEPGVGDDRALPPGPRCGPGARPRWPAVAAEARREPTARRWIARAARGRGGRLPAGQRHQRVHRRDAAVGAGQGSGEGRPAERRCSTTPPRRCGSPPCCCCR